MDNDAKTNEGVYNWHNASKEVLQVIGNLYNQLTVLQTFMASHINYTDDDLKQMIPYDNLNDQEKQAISEAIGVDVTDKDAINDFVDHLITMDEESIKAITNGTYDDIEKRIKLTELFSDDNVRLWFKRNVFNGQDSVTIDELNSITQLVIDGMNADYLGMSNLFANLERVTFSHCSIDDLDLSFMDKLSLVSLDTTTQVKSIEVNSCTSLNTLNVSSYRLTSLKFYDCAPRYLSIYGAVSLDHLEFHSQTFPDVISLRSMKYCGLLDFNEFVDQNGKPADTTFELDHVETKCVMTPEGRSFTGTLKMR